MWEFTVLMVAQLPFKSMDLLEVEDVMVMLAIAVNFELLTVRLLI